MSLSSKLRSIGAVSLTLATAISLLGGCGQVSRQGLIGSDGGWSAVTFSATRNVQPVVLHYVDSDRLTKLVEAGADVWSVDVQSKRAQAQLTAKTADVAKKLGMQVERLPQGLINNRVDKGYRTFDQIVVQLKQMAAAHPDFVQLVDIGDSWEKTQHKADRDIWALRLGTPGANKPVVTFAGCHHAREIVTPEVVMDEAQYLVDSYGKDADVTNWVNSREIYLVPMVNPDGHNIVMTQGVDQRKNANTVTGGKDRVGVDLNRNYDAVWGTVGDSGDPDSDVFRGTKAFSEPETQAMRDFLRAHKPAVYLTFHSYSNSVMWPFDSTKEKPKDPRLAILGTQLGKLSGYKPYQGCDLYLNSGDDVEWAFREMGVLAYTVEIGGWGDGFMPPFKSVPKFFKENQAMMNYSLKVADNPGAARGPNPVAVTTRAGVEVQVPGAAKAEMFVGHAGAPGSGTPLSVTNGVATLPAVDGPRQLVLVRAQGTNGVWGPLEAAWSR